MKILRCVKSNILTQGFGIDKTKPGLISLYNSLGLISHEGQDWAVVCQDNSLKVGGNCEKVYCDLDCKATITEIHKSEEYGLGIVALTEDKDGIFQHLWWHFDSISDILKVGSVLESGTYLGVAGNTGRSTGAHVHRALRPMARDTYGNLYKTQPENGYKGFVDPSPYFENIFVLDKLENLKAQVGILQKLLDLLKLMLKVGK